MKVLLVSHGYPPRGVAGVERLSAQTAGALIGRGHEVTVLTRRPDDVPRGLRLERDVRAGVSVISIAGGGSGFGRFPVREPALERVFERMLTELRPDVVLIAHLLHHSPGYVAVAHRWNVPVVLELHDFFSICPRAHLQRRSGELCEGPEGGRACATHCFPEQPDAALRWALRAESFREAVHAAEEVLAPSEMVAEALASLREDRPPIRVLEDAVADLGPVLRPEPGPGAPLHLASIGVTVPHKGHHVVVEALRRAALPAARYTILGVALPPHSGRLHEAADEVPGLELRLFNGFEPQLLPALIAEADALVVPSLVPETYSIVAREGFACGLPVVASRIGALPDAIRDDENGWLFEPGDATGLAALLQRLDGDRSLLRRAAQGARSTEVTSVAARTDRLEALLAAAIAAAAERGGRRHGAELSRMREALAGSGAARASQPGPASHGPEERGAEPRQLLP